MYCELDIQSNFSFLTGASHPHEYCSRAFQLGYSFLGLADKHSLAGVVRAHTAAKKIAKEQNALFRLLVGARVPLFEFSESEDLPRPLPLELLLYPHNRSAYARLSGLLSKGKLRAPKGECYIALEDVLPCALDLECLLIVGKDGGEQAKEILPQLRAAFGNFLSLVMQRLFLPGEPRQQQVLVELSQSFAVPLIATNGVHYHAPKRRMVKDVLTCIRLGCRIDDAGYALQENTERYLKAPKEMARLFRKWPGATKRTCEIAERASGFSLDELRYEYPSEICPEGKTPAEYLRELTFSGVARRYPKGLPEITREQIEHELRLIGELQYEKYFLTVFDIVQFAQSKGILCQGRGAAANSAVCYVLGITAVDPTQVRLLMERFISKERNEPPDIDIDFEHERREEVIQYIYQRFGRSRAALVAEVICFRTRSSFREVGKVFGLRVQNIEQLIKAFTRFREHPVTEERLKELGLELSVRRVKTTIVVSQILKGFPRHLSQHVGGFVISDCALSDIVPIENAAMEDRTVLEWDKDDVDAMGMLKIDVLALGMLTAIRKGLALVNQQQNRSCTQESSVQRDTKELYSIPREDAKVYDMICQADTIGVFQIESRAQMSMLPRLRPRTYYDLVIQVAIVRPGPIQGGMVHPFLRRRMGLEGVSYPDERVKSVLSATLGVPIFQEQVMELSVVAAGFSPGEADELRRAMASWRKDKNLLSQFRSRIRRGMLERGYSEEFAEILFAQIQGFGEYGFPQSHAASFALLVYASAWIKCHYPACFAAAILNSQPMGFYQPAQLIQDAKNHGVVVRDVDVNFSSWDCEVVDSTLQLGMRMVRGLSREEMEKILVARAKSRFLSLRDLWKRSGAKVSQLKILARADAFRSLGLDRQRSLWELGKLRDERLPLFDRDISIPREDEVPLPRVGGRAQVWRDYSSMGFSLRAHPIAFARKALRERRVQTIAEYKEESRKRPGSWVTIAGIVLMRQRPATAKKTMFMTLEDETGMANVIIRRHVQERFEAAVHDSVFAIARGRTQHEHGVTHLLLEEIYDFTAQEAMLEASSRDFR